MKKTKHATMRSQQRGINDPLTKIIIRNGIKVRRPGGAIEYRLTKKRKNEIIAQKKREINKVESAAGIGILCSVDGNIITVYHLT